MDKAQLNELMNKHDALIRLTELMETGHHCTVNKAMHSLSSVQFRESDHLREIVLKYDKDGQFVVRISEGPLRLSDKSRNALEGMSSTMAAVVKSVLNEELEEIKKDFSDIRINGEKCQPTT